MKIVLSFDVPESPEDLSFVDTERLIEILKYKTFDALIDEKNKILENLESSHKRDLAKSYDVSIDTVEVRCWGRS